MVIFVVELWEYQFFNGGRILRDPPQWWSFVVVELGQQHIWNRGRILRGRPPPGGGSNAYKAYIRKPKGLTRLARLFVRFAESSLERSQINVISQKIDFYHSKVLRIASNVPNSSLRVRKRTFLNVFRCRESEANLWRESSVVPRVERCRTLRLTASASCLMFSGRGAVVENTSCFSCSRLCLSIFSGKPFVAIKLVVVGTAVVK